MKKIILTLVLLIGTACFCNTVEAQNINISINVNQQPSWGPVGYDYVGYYYFPDINCYYNVNAGMFYYYNRGYWVSSRYLPYRYSNYDLYNLHKVVMNVRDPWLYNGTHRRSYAQYRGSRNQIIIRDSRDNRYRDSRNNNVVWYSSAPKRDSNVGHYDNTTRTSNTRTSNSNSINNRSNKENIVAGRQSRDNSNIREQNNTRSGYSKSNDSSIRNSRRSN